MPTSGIPEKELAFTNNQMRDGAMRLVWKLLKHAVSNKDTLWMDPDKAVQILDLDYKEHPYPPKVQEVSPLLVQNLMRKTIKGFADEKLLSTQLILDISKRFKPSYINGGGLSWYGATYVSPNGEMDLKDEMQFGTHESVENVQTILSTFGITLSPIQSQELMVRRDLGHEYGHSLEAAFTRKLMLEKINELDQMLGQGRLDLEAKKEVAKWASERTLQNVFELFPLGNQELTLILNKLGEKQTLFPRKNTAIERISNGLELASIRITLGGFGIKQETLDMVMGQILEQMQAGKDDFVHLYEYCTNIGIDINKTPFMLPMLKLIASRGGRKDLVPALPPQFNSTNIGYYYPLTEAQLKEWIASY